MKEMPRTKREILKFVKDNDVKFIRLWFTDVLGFLKGFAIPVEELEGALEEGMGFDGSSIEGFTRIEFRSPDPACNPYLAFSVMLAAGLAGIKNNYQLPEPASDNIYEMGEEKRRQLGIESLPDDLLEAIKLTARSELVRKTLGEKVFEFFIRNKKIEWDEYKAQVTQYEINKYLPIL